MTASYERYFFAIVRGGLKSLPMFGGVLEEILRVWDEERAKKSEFLTVNAKRLIERTLTHSEMGKFETVSDSTIMILSQTAASEIPTATRLSLDKLLKRFSFEGDPDIRRQLAMRLADELAIALSTTSIVPAGNDVSRTGLPEVGDVLNERYQLLRVLDRGGQSTVYEAEELLPQNRRTRRAVKFLFKNDSSSIERFRREIAIVNHLAGRVSNIVGVTDYGIWMGRHYSVMPMIVNSVTLDFVAEDERTRLDLVYRAAEIVEKVHQCGIIHRDLKPANFLRSQTGDLFLTDFGISKANWTSDSLETLLEDSINLTGDHVTLGTLPYMSPEQIDDARGVDVRADVYALGVMLIEAITNKRPFRGSLREVIRQQQYDEAHQGMVRLELLAHVDPELKEICMRATSLDIQFRTQSAKSLANQIFSYVRNLSDPLVKNVNVTPSAEASKDVEKSKSLTLEPEENATIGSRFRIICHIERNAWATVFRARDIDFDSDCELSFLLDCDEDRARRFESSQKLQARLATKLRSIPTVLKLGTWNNRRFSATSIVGSITSLNIMTGELIERLQRVLDAARVIASVHEHDTVHRDVRPECVNNFETGPSLI